jgi:uncharacterized protein (DUF2267 family)
MNDLGTEDHRAYAALRAVLHALRDRLGWIRLGAGGAAAPLVRGIYRGLAPGRQAAARAKREDFFAHVDQELERDPHANPEQATRAVLRLLAAHVAAGEVEAIKSTLPGEIRQLWP